MSTFELPLFPLNAVLFPGGILPLRIFEARYLDMIGSCLKNDSQFGICLLKNGNETGVAARVHDQGTVASIVDWEQLPDGLLGVTAQCEHRITIHNIRVQKNQLVIGEVEILADVEDQPLPDEFQSLSELLKHIMAEVGKPYAGIPAFYQQAGWVGARLAELLPLKLGMKQQLLEIDDPIERLGQLRDSLVALKYLKGQRIKKAF